MPSKPADEKYHVTDEFLRMGEVLAMLVEKLSPADFHARRTDDAWSVAEIAGHASEFPVMFAGKALELSRSPGLQFGRELDDPGRLAAVARLGDATPAEAAQAIRDAVDRAEEIVAEIDPAAWNVLGKRLTGEDFAVRQVIEVLVRDHLQGHLAQAREALPLQS